MGGVTGNLATPISERGDDLYETPEVAVESLIEVERDFLSTLIWEPACGPGSIARVLRRHGYGVWATDLVDYDSADQGAAGIDFLMETSAHNYDCIVTNPPFKNAQDFVAKAIELCPKVVMLLRLAFMESERRSPILDTGHLARVHVYRKRLPMMHRTGWEGRKGNSGMAFAWFVWDRNHSGPTTIDRISWDRNDGKPFMGWLP